MADASQTVSVVVPCYNYAHYLRECAESVLAQTYDNWELVIVDDGSTDNSSEVGTALARENPGKIRFLKKPNSGVAATRNIAVQQSRGELILPLDADDLLVPHAIERFVSVMGNDPTIGYVYSALENYLAPSGTAAYWYPGMFFLEPFKTDNNAACTALWRRESWDAGVRYRELIHEDWDLWLQIVSLGKRGVYIPEPLLRYRAHGTGRHATNRMRAHQAQLEVMRDNPRLFAAPYVQSAAVSLQYSEGALRKPTIVLLPSPESQSFTQFEGEVRVLAEKLVAQGHFVCAFGNYPAVRALPGCSFLQVKPERGVEYISEQLGRLGPKLLVLSEYDESHNATLRAESNVFVVEPLRDEEGCVSHEHLAGLLLQVEESAARQKEGEAQLAALYQESWSQVVEGSTSSSSFAVLLSVDHLSRKVLERAVLRARKILGRDTEIFLCYHGREEDGAVQQFGSDHDVEVCVAPEPIACFRMAEQKATARRMVFLDGAVLLHPAFLSVISRFESLLGEECLLLGENLKAIPGGVVPDTWTLDGGGTTVEGTYRQDTVYSGLVSWDRQWLNSSGGVSEFFSGAGYLAEQLRYRAALDKHEYAWVPLGLGVSEWSLNCMSQHVRRFDEQVLRILKSKGAVFGAGKVDAPESLPPKPAFALREKLLSRVGELEQAVTSGMASGQTGAAFEALCAWGDHCIQHTEDLAANDAFQAARALQPRSLEPLIGLAKSSLLCSRRDLASHYIALVLERVPENMEAQGMLNFLTGQLTPKGNNG